VTAPTPKATPERIAELERAAEDARALSRLAYRLWERADRDADLAEAALAEAQDDMPRARWLRATDPAERHATYVHMQALRALRSPGVLDVLPEPERAEVAAEAERLRAAEQSEAQS
jgi:hypothetical protein